MSVQLRLFSCGMCVYCALIFWEWHLFRAQRYFKTYIHRHCCKRWI